ncbi:MAG: class I SAM-dependent RNA methyltransferase [Deltaproteobacteria bacterium]|nr:class I SAM-dependent RNA methyltransferase [Candidatus Anaeroferrophillacea bacterium]
MGASGMPDRAGGRRYRLHLSCARGVAEVLAEEIRACGFIVTAVQPLGVELEGTLRDVMFLNLHARLANRVLLLLDSFPAASPDELYRRVTELGWEEWIPVDGYLSVFSRADVPGIRDTRFLNQKTKDAIVDRFRRRFDQRPDSGPERRGAVVFVHWDRRRCAVYLDTSGESLARRGYRLAGGKAPLQETLAAAIVRLSGWDGRVPLVNPMCGSGTLAIEAALIAANRAPGMKRAHFAFQTLKGFPRGGWPRLRQEAAAAGRQNPGGRIVAADIDPKAVARARENARRAGVEELIEFHVAELDATPVPPGGGVMLVNPPYGERLGRRDELGETYTRLGDFFKREGAGYVSWVLGGDLELLKQVGLKASRRLTLFNGPLECRLCRYELYTGTRRMAS